MIEFDYNSQSQEFFGLKPIIYIYKGSRLVWSALKSCFSKGYWVNNEPWSNKEGWVN